MKMTREINKNSLTAVLGVEKVLNLNVIVIVRFNEHFLTIACKSLNFLTDLCTNLCDCIKKFKINLNFLFLICFILPKEGP